MKIFVNNKLREILEDSAYIPSDKIRSLVGASGDSLVFKDYFNMLVPYEQALIKNGDSFRVIEVDDKS